MQHLLLQGQRLLKSFLFLSLLLCFNKANSQITVNGSLPANGVQIGNCLASNSFTFAVNNPVGNLTYSWDFGDASSSTNANPSHTYLVAGIYKVHLTTSDGTNATDYDQTIYVYPTPAVSFSVLTGTTIGNSYTFLSQSSVTSGYISSYAWGFGDGSGDVSSNPSKTYSTAGVYPVTLTVTSDKGCVNTATQNVTVTLTGSTVNSSFAANATTQCLSGNSFVLTNSSDKGNGEVYTWDFGDGNTASTYDASHSYTTLGSYTITLKVVRGTESSLAVQNITINPQPVADFTIDLNTNIASLTSASTITTGYISNYQWSLGDNTTSAQQSLQHTYATSGVYPVTLSVTSDAGCTSSIAKSVTTNVSPNVASFTTDAPKCLLNNSYQFTNTSTLSGANIVYTWDFGDGVSSNVASPAHSFGTAGNHIVTLTVTSSVGTASVSQSVFVYPQPQVSFSTSHIGTAYSFTNTSSISSGSIISYSWSSTSGNASATNNFSETVAPGSYDVTLVATSDNGCLSNVTNNYSFGASLSASFSLTGQSGICYTNANSYSFVNTSSTGADINYLWDFGDGTTSNTFQPSHAYTAAGTYLVKLTVFNAVESVATTQTIDLYHLPTASYILYLNTALTDISNGVKKCFAPGIDFSYMSSSTLAKGKMHYGWSFGTTAVTYRDGDSVDYINPRIIFDTAGTYPVKLKVTSDKGCVDSFTSIVKLSDPHAKFDYSIDYGGDVYSNPAVSVTNNSYDYGAILTNWNWSYSDGATSALQNPAVHHYTCGGSYNLSLTITSEVPCFNTTSAVVVIKVKPKAAFVISNPNYTPDAFARPTYTFTNGTTANDACPNFQYAWSFGDGYTSSSTNPTHIFKGSGTYTVQLIVTNANGGLKDTTSQSVTVSIKPKALFSTNSSNNPAISFTNSSSSTDTAATVNALHYAWDFGDGNSSGVKSPGAHLYASGGDFTITLTVTNLISGLQDIFSKVVTIKIKPHASFSVGSPVFSPDVFAQPSYTFTNNSTVADLAGNLTYSWNFGDGGSSTATSPSHVYTAGGSFTVTLTATNQNGGLQDVVTSTFTVSIKPKASFTTNLNFNGDAYANPIVELTNTSSVADVNGNLSYAWVFDDGFTTSATSPSHTFTAAGNHTVTLTVTNNNQGVTDVASSSVVIKIKPKADFSVIADYFNNTYSNPLIKLADNSSIADGTQSFFYSWTFDDGFTSTDSHPVHTFTTGGTHTITLSVTNISGGLTDQVTKSVSVDIKPKASFSSSLNYQGDAYSVPLVEVSDASTISDGSNTLTYSWVFDDGFTSIIANPSHTFSTGGSHTISLTVTNIVSGLTDITSGNIDVKVKPKASFTLGLDYNGDIHTNPTVKVTDASIIADGTNTLSYSWVFDDGFTSTDANPSHVFSVGGNHTVTLTLTNTVGGLTDVLAKSIDVVITPKAVINYTTFNDGNGLNVFVNAYNPSDASQNSSIAAGSISSYLWSVTAHNISTNQDFFIGDFNSSTLDIAYFGSDPVDWILNYSLTLTSDLGISETVTGTFENNVVSASLHNYRKSGTTRPTKVIKLPTNDIVIGISPNPVSNILNVGSRFDKTGVLNVVILNLQGKRVAQLANKGIVNTANSTKIDVSALPRGVYVVSVYNGDGKVVGTKKFVKN